jgi:hypothetical protein
MMQQIKEDFNVLSLLFKSKSHRRPVKGYLYDPETGELIPRTDLLKIKNEPEQKNN